MYYHPFYSHTWLIICCLPGAVYVYKSDDNSGTWSEIQKLVASDGDVTDEVGYAVGIYNNTIVAGAHGDDNEKGTNAGKQCIQYH